MVWCFVVEDNVANIRGIVADIVRNKVGGYVVVGKVANSGERGGRFELFPGSHCDSSLVSRYMNDCVIWVIRSKQFFILTSQLNFK